MKRYRRIAALVLSAVLAAGLMGCGGQAATSEPASSDSSAEAEAEAEETEDAAEAEEAPAAEPSGDVIKLKLSHYRAEDSIADNDAKEFAKNVAAADSSLQVDIYPAAQLGDYTTVQELVSVGDVEMQLATLASQVDKYLGITSAPYICSTWDEAKAIFGKESKFTDTIADHLAQQNIKLLAVYPLYFGGVISNKEVKDPADMDSSKGIKIRCQQMKGAELVSNMLGYMPTPMPLSDCFTALQTGTIDGMIGSGAEGYYTGYKDVATWYLPYNDHFEVWYLYINMDKWNSLNESQQTALQEAADKLEADRWEVAPTQTAEFEQKLAEEGIEVIEFTDEELQAFYDRCQETVWPELTELYGQEAVDLVASLKGN